MGRPPSPVLAVCGCSSAEPNPPTLFNGPSSRNGNTNKIVAGRGKTA